MPTDSPKKSTIVPLSRKAAMSKNTLRQKSVYAQFHLGYNYSVISNAAGIRLASLTLWPSPSASSLQLADVEGFVRRQRRFFVDLRERERKKRARLDSSYIRREKKSFAKKVLFAKQCFIGPKPPINCSSLIRSPVSTC